MGTPKRSPADLHVHLGGAVPASVLWESLCNQGLQTQHKSFDDLQKALTATTEKVRSLDDFLGAYFHTTEEIQSSPEAITLSAYQAVAKASRRSGVKYMELRFNPAKRLRGNTHKMDAIILAALQGLARATLHYGVETATILSLGRDCTQKTNTAIVEAAIKWKNHGIVGIDMAGPESTKKEEDPAWFEETVSLFRQARAAGLKLTYHIGETPDSGWKGVERILHTIRPDRIGHGIQIGTCQPKKKSEILETLAATNTCLEICPSVNIVTRSASLEKLQSLAETLLNHWVPFCACTDNPYLVHTNIRAELEKLCTSEVSKDWAKQCADSHAFRKSDGKPA